MENLYGAGHPSGRMVGEADYRRITSDVLREFYNCHYHAANCSIYVAGKVTDDCLRRLETCFGTGHFGASARHPP